MKWILTLCVLVLSLSDLAQAEEQPVAKEKPKPAATTAPTKKLPPKPISFAELKFAEPLYVVRIQQLKKMIDPLADDTWEHGDWYYREGLPDFRTWWSSNPETHDRFGSATAHRPLGKAGHNISIQACGDFSKKDSPIQSIKVTASWHPPQSGWGAQLWYTEGSSPYRTLDNFGFQVIRWTAGETWEQSNRLNSQLQLASYRDMQKFGGIEYYVFVGLHKKYADGQQLSNDEINVWLASPDSFRAAALARLESIRTLVQTELNAGRGIDARIPAFDGKPTSQLRLQRSTRPHNHLELQQLIETAKEELGERMRLIKENHVEMQSALTRAFPLMRFLEQP